MQGVAFKMLFTLWTPPQRGLYNSLYVNGPAHTHATRPDSGQTAGTPAVEKKHRTREKESIRLPSGFRSDPRRRSRGGPSADGDARVAARGGSEPHRATSEVLACVRADASSSLLLGSNSCGRPEGRVERVSSKNHFCQFTNESYIYIHTMNRATAVR